MGSFGFFYSIDQDFMFKKSAITDIFGDAGKVLIQYTPAPKFMWPTSELPIYLSGRPTSSPGLKLNYADAYLASCLDLAFAAKRIIDHFTMTHHP